MLLFQRSFSKTTHIFQEHLFSKILQLLTASVNVIAVLHQYENYNDISNFLSASALTQFHEHQLKALLLKGKIYQQKNPQKVSIVLTCMNSKKEFHHLNYQMTGKYLTTKTTFSKKANLMKYLV